MISHYTKWRELTAPLTLLLTLLFLVSMGQAQSSSTLSGVVTDSFGASIPEATITIYSPDRVLQARTDQTGRFSFTNAPPGKYEIEASRPGFKTQTGKAVQIENRQSSPIAITLAVANAGECQRLDSISYKEASDAGRWKLIIRVLDAGRPLSQANLSISGTFDTRQPPISQVTDDRGELRFGKLEAGHYILKVSHPGYHYAQTVSFWISRENQTTVEVEMLREGLIRVCE